MTAVKILQLDKFCNLNIFSFFFKEKANWIFELFNEELKEFSIYNMMISDLQ